MVNCSLCKSESKLIWKEKNYKLYRCLNCKVVFLYPVPETEKIYNRDYFEKWYLRYYDKRKQYFKNLIEKLQNYLPEKGKILDIGCGVGIFLDIMKENGWDVCGQDISPFAVEYCKKKGFRVFKGNVSDIKISEKFNLITMFDVIAHIPNPLHYLEKTYKLLKKNGILIIKTPYHNNFLFKTVKFLAFTGRSRSLLHIPAQIYHFNKFSIKNLPYKTNFEIIKIIIIKDFIKKKIDLKNMIKFTFGEKSIVLILQPNQN